MPFPEGFATLYTSDNCMSDLTPLWGRGGRGGTLTVLTCFYPLRKGGLHKCKYDAGSARVSLMNPRVGSFRSISAREIDILGAIWRVEIAVQTGVILRVCWWGLNGGRCNGRCNGRSRADSARVSLKNPRKGSFRSISAREIDIWARSGAWRSRYRRGSF